MTLIEAFRETANRSPKRVALDTDQSDSDEVPESAAPVVPGSNPHGELNVQTMNGGVDDEEESDDDDQRLRSTIEPQRQQNNQPDKDTEDEDEVDNSSQNGQKEPQYTTVEHPNRVVERENVPQPSMTADDDDDNDDLVTWVPDRSVRLRLSDTGPGSERPMTLIEAFRETANRSPKRVALAVKTGDKWTGYTYDWYYDRVCCAAKAFIELGLEPFHGVAIIGFNAVEWFISFYASIAAGGLACGVYPTNSAEACLQVLENGRCDIVIVENEFQLKKIIQIQDKLTNVKAVVQYHGKPSVENVLSWDELMTIGDANDSKMINELQQRIASLQPNKCCAVLHTSGTTGDPKGVMMSHDNLVWTAMVGMGHIGCRLDQELIVSYLPLSHSAALLFDVIVGTLSGATIYFAQPDAFKGSLVETLKDVRPTRFLGVPRVWEKFQEAIETATRNQPKVKEKIFNVSRKLSYRSQMAAMRGEPKYAGFSIGRKLVYSKVRRQLGLDRCVGCYCGAAPISIDTLNFFLGLDIPIYEVYGETECSGPQTVNIPNACVIGSVGREVPGMKTAFIADENTGEPEICMSGRNVFMGYINSETETRKVVDKDGWLHSGDIGHKDARGFLFITGRIKELIVTAGGENIPPLLIEERVKQALPCVSNCVLIGDRRKFLLLLITIKTVDNTKTGEPGDELRDDAIIWCKSVGSSAKTLSEILESPDVQVLKAIQQGIDEVNKKSTSRAQCIQKWSVLPQDFTVTNGELGPTLKLKRKYIEEIYADTIQAFYDDNIK
jgi:long-chain-fatty-acid--CoA ligase ACSBG